ncbi:beta-ketoacyl-[acyl-carrier-protein] synthase family protein [Autumnicola musiva]|uniref:Beta-ketoacyl-[acyl-carrier-protein] synthase family protein n=1 Tax=Autumnicola musiva TaxID=3075589 RepID=A0ABU3D726_9FLAO|nr:beta-ketoacyl-[acyl-carrier-protein] synthase family protein [Zunongwangia sp. F117]MDT0677335.1 beta-ketoacyl-[acyl-carrier-protein] synthase family protein [Zunongwangia sp. F117]
MDAGVAVTGIGIISSIGRDVGGNYQNLINGNCGISKPEILETLHKGIPVGEIKISNTQLYEMLSLPHNNSYTRAALLAVLAIKEALSGAGLNPNEHEIGLISGTSVGGIDMTEKFFNEYGENSENLRYIQAQHPGFTTGQIADYFVIKNFVTTISTACSSGANAIMLGARMIKSGRLKRVIVGGSDCLSKFTLNGFNSLKILSSEVCRPFDNRRNGLNLGEGAAYLILEADDILAEKPVLGRVSGYGNANDAFHQTASSETGEGAFLAMKKALEVAGLSPEAISYINAHGTATINNDLSESRALKRIFKDNIPDFSSTKAFTGHTLAAAGALEAVYSLLSLQNNMMFKNANFEHSMEETALVPVQKTSEKELQHVLSNSFGFGGNCTSLIFSRNGK